MSRMRLVVAVLSAAAALAVIGCAGTSPIVLMQPPGTIKVFSSFPLTGGDSADGISLANSTRLAFENHGPQSGNYTLVLEAYDDASLALDAWDPEIVTAHATKAAADPQVLLYLGTYNSGAARIAIPILNRAGPLAMLSGGNTAIGLTKGIPGVTPPGEPDGFYPTGIRNYLRVVPGADHLIAVNVDWAQELGAKTVYILHDKQQYGEGVARLFEQLAKDKGIEVLGIEGIDTQSPDYRAEAARIVSANPDLFFFGGPESSDGSQVWKDLRAAGYTGMMMSADGLYTPLFTRNAGEAAEGTYITFVGDPLDQLLLTDPETKAFHDQYVERFNAEPTVYGAYGYEAAQLALKAIDECTARNDASRKCVLDTLFATKDFGGVLGYTYSIDENGDPTQRGVTRYVIENGEFKFLDMQLIQ